MGTMNEYTANRTHPRRPLEKLLTLERWNPDSELKVNETFQAHGIDISSGGLGLMASQALQVGEVVRLEISINGNGVTLPVYSEVVWSRVSNDGARAGLRFLM